jgi:hypothetical protein
VPPGQPNVVLASCLARLGWSPRALARRINRLFGPDTVAETAPYYWRDRGGLPRPPVPGMVAWVLTRELGRVVTAAELWHGRADAGPALLPADADMQAPWSRPQTLRLLDDWVTAGLIDRRSFLAISGAALTTIAADYLAAEPAAVTSAIAGGGVSGPLLEQIEHSLPFLQRLDDAHGGGRHLEYVSAQFRAVALLARQRADPEATTRRLLGALAELGQLAGWMAVDAGRHGLAQRYLFTALRAAHQSGHRPMAAHILADLGYQAALQQRTGDAVALGEAARHAARTSTPGVRASVASRLAYAYVLAGRLDDFDRTRGTARHAITGSKADPEPAWMYYLTPNHLDTQAGYGLIHAATLARGPENAATARRLARRGQTLLSTGVHDVSLEHGSQRRALFEGAWLAVGYATSGDLERACYTGRAAVARLDRVASSRSTEVLHVLAARLRRRGRNEYVRDFLPDLDSALTRHGMAGHPALGPTPGTGETP